MLMSSVQLTIFALFMALGAVEAGFVGKTKSEENKGLTSLPRRWLQSLVQARNPEPEPLPEVVVVAHQPA